MRRFFFTASLLLFCTSVFAYDIEVNNSDGITIYYNYINNKSELEVTYKDTYYRTYKGDVVIPESVTYMDKSYKVTCIGNRAFYDCNDLKNITIPKTVITFKKEAFSSCDGFSSFTIPNSVTTIGEKAFSNCKKLISIVIPNNVTSIGDYAFQLCKKLSSVTFGNGLVSIGEGAFASCGLTTVTIPDNVTSIGDLAFSECKSLISITLPNNLKEINTSLLMHCVSLPSVVIPNSVRTICIYAFASCDNLTSVKMPNKLKNIYAGAFQKCKSLTTITIPSNVDYIESNVFEYTDLSIVISEIIEPFDISGYSSSSRVFSQPTFNNATLYVPDGTIEKYKATEGWKDFLNIKEGLPSTSIDNAAINRVDNSSIYNLNGQCVGNNLEGLSKGIYIKEGKKHVVK